MHGFSINVECDMEGFSHIIPCGLEGKEVGNLRDFVPDITVAEVRDRTVKALEKVFNLKAERVHYCPFDQCDTFNQV